MSRQVSVLDGKFLGGLQRRSLYPTCGTQGVPRRVTAFSCNSGLRMTATTATLPH